MTDTTPYNAASFGEAVREQFKAMSLLLRFALMIAAVPAIIATFLAFADFFQGRGGVDFAPELTMIPAFAGVLLPVAIWHRDRPFGARFFWTLPVDRTRHALAKMIAGWLWLMLGVSAFVLWLLILAVITRGNIVGDEIVRVLTSPTTPTDVALDPSLIKMVRWFPHPGLWLAPFTAATGVYVIVSAITLGFRYPFRWIAGAIAAAFLVAAVGQGLASDSFWHRLNPLVMAVMQGRYSIDSLLTARAESLHTVVALTTGKVVPVWKALPVLSDWLIATLLWTGLGIAGVCAALFRNRERR